MKPRALRRFLPAALIAGLTCPAIAQEQIFADGGTRVVWQRIVGLAVPDSIVGRRAPPPDGGCEIGVTCAVGAPGPWAATGGHAEVNLDNGNLRFNVRGLVLADDFNGVNLGTPNVVTKVKGTLVCNDTDPGFAELVDTEAVRLSAAGNATFSGHGNLPASCTEEPEDMVFVIRIAGVSAFEGLIDMWIAFGAARVIRR
jgi:hypothetical protein